MGTVERTWQATYAELFHAHVAGLVRLATLLGADDPEDVVQDAFVRLHRSRRRLRDPARALPYLRTTVVNLSRSRLRHLAVVRPGSPATSLPRLGTPTRRTSSGAADGRWHCDQ